MYKNEWSEVGIKSILYSPFQHQEELLVVNQLLFNLMNLGKSVAIIVLVQTDLNIKSRIRILIPNFPN